MMMMIMKFVMNRRTHIFNTVCSQYKSSFKCTLIIQKVRLPGKRDDKFYEIMLHIRPPLCYSGQSSWLQIQRSRILFPALPDFLRNSGSQPREDN
jgi:hypothetical protein